MDNKSKSDKYFCVFCAEVITFRTKTSLQTHLKDLHLNDCNHEESHAIDVWLERHLQYQESLIKSMSQSIKTIPDRSKTIYRGCPVCDKIIKVFNINEYPQPKGTDSHELLIKDINVDYSGNNVNHINPHLKYYPYECLICEEEYQNSCRRGDLEVKDVVKTAVKPMMRRHIIDKHLKDVNLKNFEVKVETSMRSLKVRALEKLTKRQTPERGISRPSKRKSTPGPLRTPKSEPKPSFKLFTVNTVNGIPVNLATIGPKIQLPVSSFEVKSFIPPIAIIKGVNNTVNTMNTSGPSNGKYLNIKPKDMPKAQARAQAKVKEADESVATPEDQMSVSSEEDFYDFKCNTKHFGCLFCLKVFSNYEKTFEHYLKHINVFIECKECDLKFQTIQDFRSHNPIHNEIKDFKALTEFKSIRKWIQKFLIDISKDRQTVIDTTLDITQAYCPVCVLLSEMYNIESDKQLAKEESIESHIHKHLNYFPFECIDCGFEFIETEYTLDSKAIKHLSETHSLSNAENLNTKELCNYFIKSHSIEAIDALIDRSLQIHNKITDFWIINSKENNF